MQDMMVVLTELGREGFTIDDILTFGKKIMADRRSSSYETLSAIQSKQSEYISKARRCKCGEVMILSTVNDTPASQVGGVYRSMWSCSDPMGCGETLYSDRVIHEEAEAHGLGFFFPDPKKVPTARELRRRHGKRMRTKFNQPHNPKNTCGGCK
jgi:hypothetical protein